MLTSILESNTDANFTAVVTKKTLKQIQTKQNRAIKALYNLDYLTPTKQMHKNLKLLMVDDIGKINTLKFVHNQRNNKTPIVFKNYFIENRAIHQHNTRQSKDLHNTHANSNKKTTANEVQRNKTMEPTTSKY